LARVTYEIRENGRKLWQNAATEGVELFKAAGAKEAWHGPMAGQHIMGGTVMGSDPTQSVTNGEAQCHDLPNLFVGGPSVFPTSSSINSTFTAHAVAMKSAHFMARHWGQLAD